jgi:OHCU decarboxylase
LSKGLERLNALPREEAEAELLKCCGSANWARGMAARRPFHEMAKLLKAADLLWWKLGHEDWLEAFSRHPKIGRRAAQQAGPTATERWADEEQAGTRSAAEDLLAALAKANSAYEARFGYIFIVCATGKTSEEMLALLRKRLQNGPVAELRIAAEEQRRITRLRLEKLLGPA